MADFRTWNLNTLGWCPREGGELMGLSSNPETLFEHIDNLDGGYGSGSDHGMAWAFATLDPNWKGKFPETNRNRPVAYNNRHKKVIIFMANSNTNDQRYPTPDELNAPAPVHTTRSAYKKEEAREAFLDLCKLSKEKDVEIFTVGFDVTRNKTKKELKECATSATHYHEAKTKQLEETYEEIANYLSALRLTK